MLCVASGIIDNLTSKTLLYIKRRYAAPIQALNEAFICKTVKPLTGQDKVIQDQQVKRCHVSFSGNASDQGILPLFTQDLPLG